jgi:hypothetical protein
VLIDGYGSSGGSNGSNGGSSDGSSGSWEVLEAPEGGAAASEQQQRGLELEGKGSSVAAVAQAAATAAAAAAAAAVAEGPPVSGRPRSQGRRVSFSSEVMSSDDDKQQQQQQRHQETQQQQQQQQQQEEDGVSGDVAADGVCGDSEETRGVGAVGWGMYASYFKAVGVAMCCAVLGSLIAMQVRLKKSPS